MDALDRPVWGSLDGAHAALAEGGPLAKRYRRDVNVFAAAADDSAEAQVALAALLRPGDRIFIAQAADIAIPPGLAVVKQARCVQMVAAEPLRETQDVRAHRPLNEADAGRMLDLATLTEPGPFLSRTHTMGRFVGVHRDGDLVAMAGERFRLRGFVEVSAVCTHPRCQGQGLARQLSAAVAARIQAEGDTPFLHAWESNHVAIALYRSLGFRVRCLINVAVLEARDTA